MQPGEALGALYTTEGRDDPYPYYTALVEQAPVFVGEYATVVSGYGECNEVIRDQRLLVPDTSILDGFFGAQWRSSTALTTLHGSMLLVNPPDHARMRGVFRREFTARRVAALRPAVTDLTETMLDHLAELGAGGAPVDFMAEFAFRLPVSVIGELLGVPPADRAAFRALSADLTRALEPWDSLDALTEADEAAVRMCHYFAELVERRRREPGEDLVSALAAPGHDADRRDGGVPLSEEELVANLVLLMVAGFETTTNLLGNGLRLLLDRPEHAARLRAAPELAPAYVEEILRFDSPVQFTSRITAAPTDVAGRREPAGRELLLLLGAANRDPRRFADPSRFVPDRADNQPLSFGGGPHFCIGAALARQEAQVALPLLLRRFPDLAAAGTPTRRDRLTLRGYEHLPVTVG